MKDISFQEAKKILISLSEDDSKTPKDVEFFFNKFLINKPQPIFEISESAFFIRCTINSDATNAKNEDIVFKKVSRCSYNPNLENIRLQRRNYEHQPMFYAALARNDTNSLYTPTIAILETCWDVVKNMKIDKKYFTISKWKINKPLQMIALPFFSIGWCPHQPKPRSSCVPRNSKVKQVCETQTLTCINK